MIKHITSALVTISLPFLVQGQTPLVPSWSHTWPFGQQGPMFVAPSDADNHVAFDLINDQVYLTIDDQLEQQSPRWDFLFSFDANGTDITPLPASLLGSATPTVNDPQNMEGTHDLVARDGVVYHARELNTGFQSGTSGSLCTRNPDGSGWKLGLGKGGFAYGNGKVLVDDQGAVSVRSLDGFTAMMQATSPEGWIQWTKTYPTFGPFDDAVLMGNTIVAARAGTFVTIDRATGQQLVSNVVYLPNLPATLATDGARVFFAYSDFSSNVFWGCVVLGSTPIWVRSAALDITITELEVDAFGRPWFVGNSTLVETPPVLVVTGTDGSAYDLFTYGSSMNDLAIGAGQAYITGRLDDTNTTYLLAVSTDISTAVEPVVAPSVSLYPQPASASLNIGGGIRLSSMRVLDATGQTVQVPLLTTSTLDVSKLTEGIYFLAANTANGRIAKRFVVVR